MKPSDVLPQPLPERTTVEIQRARTMLAEIRQVLDAQMARLRDLNDSLSLVMEGPPPGVGVRLTSQEREILRLVAQGYTTYAIWEHLDYPERTVQTYLHNINVKLGTRTRLMAALKAWQLGLI